MAQIAAVISTTDAEFRAQVARLVRTCGLSIALVEERPGSGSAAPDVALADIRTGGAAAQRALERLRSAYPSASIVAVAADAAPEQILGAMRAGANEFVAWTPSEDGAAPGDVSLRAALQRTVERIRASGEEARRGRTLAFFGAKGGAGTTTLAVNTATDLARESGRPVLIVDLRPFLGEVALFLGVRPRFTLVDALDNLHRLDAEFLRELVARHKSGLDLLSGPEQVDRPGAHDAAPLEGLLQMLTRSYAFVVLDAGSLAGPCAEVAVCAADDVYLVANPDVPSIRNTQRLVDRLASLGAGADRVHVLLNRTSEEHVIGPRQIEEALGHPVRHAFASDYRTVSAALNAGIPLTLSNHSELAGQLGRFTRGILNTPADANDDAAPRRRGQFLGLF